MYYAFICSVQISINFLCICSANIFWKAFSPYVTNFNGGQRADLYDGAVISSIFHSLIASGEDELSAMHQAFGHRNLPDVAGMVAACAFFLIVLSLQGFHVTLPLRPRNQPALQVNYSISLSYIAFAILLFQDTLLSALYFSPQVVHTPVLPCFFLSCASSIYMFFVLTEISLYSPTSENMTSHGCTIMRTWI